MNRVHVVDWYGETQSSESHQATTQAARQSLALPGQLRKRFPGRGLRERIAVFPPGEMAILAIKFLRENFHREKNARDSRGDKFPGQLRILDPRRLALRAANGRADLGVAGLPFEHQLVRLLEIVFVHEDL